MGRGAEPEDVAPAIGILANVDAGYVTGVSLRVAGGFYASNGQPPLS